MATVTIRANVAPLITRWRIKGEYVIPGTFAAADRIASATNRMIPDYFPGRVAKAITTEPESGSGLMLAGVRGVAKAPLFYWYTKGTHPHPIDPVNAHALAFYWQRVDEHVVFAHVNHPGGKAHMDTYEAFLAAFREEAYTQWRDELRQLLVQT